MENVPWHMAHETQKKITSKIRQFLHKKLVNEQHCCSTFLQLDSHLSILDFYFFIIIDPIGTGLNLSSTFA